ncbi:hypothetical protein V7x_21630 [Crateriforma conspicua]|uniref:SLA1 homology domain-containing protein n=1 Tax=Crateriforma conspicua TaxID=2527996 RepID=A0A5C6FW87_9PLAN|nr:SHD1 domain-containing protein [Crateriforma conspicua]TWU66594.1 hypothetical protein V7x_21630 [Crateriforma conspicua]
MIALGFSDRILRALSPVILLAAAACLATPAHARTWTDKTGVYTIDADLFAFNDEHVVLQRADGELGMYKLEDLSDADREYLKDEDALEASQANLDKQQVWTLTSGAKVKGLVVDYARVEVSIQRRRGKLYINDRAYKNLPPVYQVITRKVVAQIQQKDDVTEQEMFAWVRTLGGEPKKVTIEGVLMELADENEYVVPFFLFDDASYDLLQGGWQQWLAAHEKDDYEAKDDETFRLQSSAASAYQRQQFDQQIAIANLNMNAIRAGVTSLWEVTLYPKPGNPYPPRWITVYGRDSLVAQQQAQMRFPAYTIGSVRKVSR